MDVVYLGERFFEKVRARIIKYNYLSGLLLNSPNVWHNLLIGLP